MSLYGEKWTVDGVKTGFVKRVGTKYYEIRFEREYVKIEDIEGINWDAPAVIKLGEEECPLPAGSFATSNITYNGAKKYYSLFVNLERVSYGDVSAYAAELEHRQQVIEQKNAELDGLNGDLEEADATVESLYEQLNASEEQNVAKDQQISALSDELAEADETVQALYEQMNGETEEQA